MLDKQIVIDKMSERGFVVYANMGKTKIQFLSSHMYNLNNENKLPILNIIVDLEKDEFEGIYNVEGSINTLNSPKCGSVLNDNHFNKIISKLETQAKWLERIR